MQRALGRLSSYLSTTTLFSPSLNNVSMSTTTTTTTIRPSEAVVGSKEPHIVNSVQPEWRAALAALPTVDQNGGKIPSIYLAHGQPLLIHPPHLEVMRLGNLVETQGPNGTLANFLRDLGPTLMEKWKPKAIVVFSAHWETSGEIVVSDYGDSNPLLYDYFGFPDELYKVKFESRGDTNLSKQIVRLLKAANIPARTTGALEARGEDGRGFSGPGFDHGVFVPFKLMFGEVAPIPIVQVSINQSLSPADEWALGAALEPLRSDEILIIAGGLTIHTFRDFGAFGAKTAKPVYKSFDEGVLNAVSISDPKLRQKALYNLVHHPGFRPCHPREEHFVPIYVAGGASDAAGGRAECVSGIHGAKTIVYGLQA